MYSTIEYADSYIAAHYSSQSAARKRWETPNSDTITGEMSLLSGIHREIYASVKAKNPDGTVSYTLLE